MDRAHSTRREFVGGVAVAALALPVVLGGERTAVAAGDTWTATVKPEELAAGYKVYRVEKFVLSRVGDTVMALSATCTHNACVVKPGMDRRDKEKGLLACPCHGGKYDGQGNVAGGPPTKALWRHPIRLGAGGVIEVNTAVKVAAAAGESVLMVK